MDALAHITVGADNHWYGNHRADRVLGDHGPMKADGSKFLPVSRGVMLDVPKFIGTEILPKRYPIDGKLLEKTARSQGIEVRSGDVVLIRTGIMKKWPHQDISDVYGSGINLDGAIWLSDRGVICVGSDNEAVEQLPSEDPNNPLPVHTLFLIQKGIYLIEFVNVEMLARDQVYEFLFIAAPLTIRNATGSMVNPLAII